MRTLALTAALILSAFRPDPHPWIADLQDALADLQSRWRAGDVEGALADAEQLVGRVQESSAAWKDDLESPRERRLLAAFGVFVRDIPAALRRNEPPRMVADAFGRCRTLLDNLRVAHEG